MFIKGNAKGCTCRKRKVIAGGSSKMEEVFVTKENCRHVINLNEHWLSKLIAIMSKFNYY